MTYHEPNKIMENIFFFFLCFDNGSQFGLNIASVWEKGKQLNKP